MGVCLIFGCLARLWMLFLVSIAKTYPGFTKLASAAKLYLITLVVWCLCYFRMLCLCLDAILVFSGQDVSWLDGARFARKSKISLHLSLGVCLIFGCFACLPMPFLVSNAKTYPGFTELASLAKLYLITLAFGCLCYFRMLSLSLYAMLGFECWDVSWLHGARFARKIIFNHTCR